ncbi:helix-turn-helix transcriptional regulator [Flavobacterium sp. Fl-318]|uniref:Helix-turn-helix transcriptional regulator n=1 Tax=Flavobacterium cupriresistens TaxID=2893885 RepID=A0ABU4RFL1_9FLAO|nr:MULTISPECIES: helix-turn-helix transcriptional regulator [unclassified Flavobacterium]MDX6190255.1 helix-turn-helix transcriptional regulator [Flavobacterium sp. Fl-318]UFH43073.1 helix-turn-helix transcriptional regulator [Flavobacterium sp. F-323]
MESKPPIRLKNISEFHKFWALPKPEHPLISVVDYKHINHSLVDPDQAIIMDYYSIAIKRDLGVKMIYGQESFDFDEGLMFFMAPNQVFKIEKEIRNTTNHAGWILLIHPDFLWNSPLAKTIKKYEFFNYSMHEALFLSEKEEGMIINIIQNIQLEYHSNIDTFSQNIIISQLETLLNYSERFYQRQFITRKIANHKILERIEDLLDTYFNDDLSNKGLPTVKFIAESLNISPNYMSGLLKLLTGQSTQQHIQNKILEKAKEKLSTTNLSVSEIAYELGFEHSQSFNKFFKNKTKLSPIEFRTSFN